MKVVKGVIMLCTLVSLLSLPQRALADDNTGWEEIPYYVGFHYAESDNKKYLGSSFSYKLKEWKNSSLRVELLGEVSLGRSHENILNAGFQYSLNKGFLSFYIGGSSILYSGPETYNAYENYDPHVKIGVNIAQAFVEYEPKIEYNPPVVRLGLKSYFGD